MIANSWEREPRWSTYLKKRVLRIYPGFVVAYLLSVLVVGAVGADNDTAYFNNLHLGLMAREMLLLHDPSTSATFEGSYYDVVNGPLWTIQYEFLCYLMVMALGLAGVLASVRLTTILWLASVVAFFAFRARHGDSGPGAIMGGPRRQPPAPSAHVPVRRGYV